ncbi:MAG: cellulose binding domain-containing protein [Lachnospiraceae bacterium]|nr:cellulose binding domain-containing protein [Lachnospiraceae bacterium]
MRMKQITAILLSLSMIVGGSNVTTFAQNTISEVNVGNKVNGNDSWDGVTREKVFNGKGFRVTYKLQSTWNGGYNASVVIDNIGTETIENWMLGFNYYGGISNVWNAELEMSEQGEYIVKNVGWNQDIAAGKSVEFGINGKGDFAGFPSEYQMLGQISSVKEEDFNIDYTVTSDWKTGFNADITITNNTSDKLVDWVLEFDFDRNITEIWNATIVSHEGNHYVVKNKEYNSVIKPEKSISFGFSGTDGSEKDVPSNYIVSAFQNECTVTFEVGDGIIKNAPDKQIVKKGMKIIKPTQPEKEGNIFVGWYLDKEFSKPFNFENMSVDKDTVLYAFWIESNGQADSDGDGLKDDVEIAIGTNPKKEDSDGDGLSDYIEIVLLGTDPLKTDSDGNGVLDGDEDFDGDGLSNNEEISYKTNIREKDSDYDNLDDYEEIFTYFTNPSDADTDGDGLNDYSEIKLGTDPDNSDSNGNGTVDGEELFTQDIEKEKYQQSIFENNYSIPTIKITAKGDVNSRISVSEYDGHLKGDEREYVGKAIEIRDSNVEKGDLTFTISNDYELKTYTLGSYTTNGLMIFFNDGSDSVPMESTFDEEKRELKCNIKADGIYFVVNIVEWLDSLGIDLKEEMSSVSTDIIEPVTSERFMPAPMVVDNYSITAESKESADDIDIAKIKIKGQVDIVFVVDTTGSMNSYIKNVKNNLIAFVEELEEANIKSNFALVDYRDITCDGEHSTNVKQNDDGSNWFKSATDFKKEIEKLTVGGGGDLPETAVDALEMARQLDMRKSSQKFFILVTDAGYKINNNYGISSMEEMINLLVNDEINTSVVSNGKYSETYRDLYEKTGGVFANVSGNFKDELLNIAKNIKDKTNDGYWIALNGLLPQIIKLDEKPSLTSTVDTDKDGLRDNAELNGVMPTKTINVMDYLFYLNIPVELYGKYIGVYDYHSNPAKVDTDGDGINDKEDIEPKTKNVEPYYIKKYINNHLINMKDMEATSDGFFICEKPLSEIFVNAGISEIVSGSGDKLSVEQYYDDWYIMALDPEVTTYGLYKMREQENDGGDNDDPGVTISFVGLDIYLLNQFLEGEESDTSKLYEKLAEVTNSKNPPYSDVLQGYFSNVESDGSYLIADAYVNKIARTSLNNSYISFPNILCSIYDKVEKIDEAIDVVLDAPFGPDSDALLALYREREDAGRVPDALSKINTDSGKKIVDENNRRINVVNKSNLSYYEKKAILSAYTADTSFNMFAAEVQAHAVFVTNWKSFFDKWYNSAVRADMAIGEEYESGMYDSYYSYDSDWVKDQVKAHGEY